MSTPFGIIAQPLQNFREMLVRCPAFQAWVKETDSLLSNDPTERAATCLDYTFLIKYTKPSTGYVYPVAIVDLPEDAGYAAVSVNANGIDHNNGRGSFDVTLLRLVPEVLRSDDAAAWLDYTGLDTNGTKSGLGQIIEELFDLSMSGGYLWINQIDLAEGPWWIKEEKKVTTKPIIGAKLRITWGIN